ncbi:MAG: low molecular weight phosphotyrosine protein phosphatase [Rhodospirillales bacterium]|nr:low molecular weight phosphotyrosine protein phosphatase [Rhodospirillales bacterium]
MERKILSIQEDILVKVLFVCLGNICRSAIAEGVFRDLVEQAELSEKIQVDSCGTGSFHTGETPDPRSIEACAAREIDISNLRARQIRNTDFEKFDYVIAMDEDNVQALQAVCPFQYEERIHLFLEMTEYMGTREVPDPYYGTGQGFERVLNLIERASKRLLESICENDLK